MKDLAEYFTEKHLYFSSRLKDYYKINNLRKQEQFMLLIFLFSDTKEDKILQKISTLLNSI